MDKNLSFPKVNFKIEPSLSIPDTVYNHLKQEILNSQIPEGAILVESRSAE
jgi:DNA-binding GntR family transcriptional regulator